MQNIIKSQILETANLLEKVATDFSDLIEKIIISVVNCYNADGTLYFFGNGGSAADCQHLAAEFVCRFKMNRRALKALALTTDTSFLTACGNDFSFERIFERQVEAFVTKNDVCFGISTSGNSKNVFLGLEKAKNLGAKTIGFLGCEGGIIKKVSDLSLVIPTTNTPKIQECHITIGHIICDLVEKELFS